jgi:hypothetical protein
MMNSKNRNDVGEGDEGCTVDDEMSPLHEVVYTNPKCGSDLVESRCHALLLWW